MNDHIEKTILHGYLDNELDPARSLEIESHLQECQACARNYQNLQILRSVVRNRLPYYRTPMQLRKRVDSMVKENRKEEQPRLQLTKLWPWLGLGFGASVALATLIFLSFVAPLWKVPAENDLVQEVLSSHVRSLMANHLTDVVSTDLHTVKPWFNSKLDFSPTVKDLAQAGFPLVGGRLDYIDKRPVAALVFQHQKHLINLFTWPIYGEKEEKIKNIEKQGYHVLHWSQSGMEYWAISDLNELELQKFVRLYQ
jgi:anti-sigma factor RsiW